MNLLRIGAERWSVVLITEQVLTELSDWGSAKETQSRHGSTEAEGGDG